MNVLITRPLHQAQALGEAIRQTGDKPIFYPTITIVKIPADNIQIPPNPPFSKGGVSADIVIFTSSNATLSDWMPAFAGMTVVAIGAATAQALAKQGIQVDAIPETFNTEGLLALPCLQNIHTKTIIIFKGQGGRTLLTDTLRAREANVTEAIVYRREIPTDLPDLKVTDIDVIISTSQESLQNLVTLTDIDQVRHLPLIVISQRVAQFAQQLGFTQPPIIADNASNAALVTAFIDWRHTL